MATVRITGPDGRTARLTIPDNAPPDVIEQKIAQIKTQWGGDEQKTAVPAEDPRVAALREPGMAQRALRGFPVINEALDEIGAAADSAINTVSGGYLGEDYDTSLQRRRNIQKKSDAENPVRNTVDAVLGAVATAPAIPFRAFVQGAGAIPGAVNTALNAVPWLAAQGFAGGEGGFENRVNNATETVKSGAPIALGLGGIGGAIAARLRGTPQNSVTAQAANLGIETPRFMDTGVAGRTIGAKLGALPFVGDDINAAVQSTREQAGQAAANIADNYAPGATPQGAGEALRGSLTNFAGPRAAAIQDRAYQAVNNAMPQGQPLPLMATRRAVAELERQGVEAASPLHAQAIAEVRDALARPNGLSFEGLTRLRTRIGTIRDNTIDPNNRTQQAGLSALYRGLTDDIQTAVATNGGQAGQQAWDRANAVARRVAERRDTAARLVGSEGDKAGEGIIDRVVAMASTKSSADAARLSQLRRTAGADQWREVSAAAIQRLGRNQSNQFSADIFLKNFRQLSPRGAQLLFRSTGQDDLYQALQQLSNVSESLQQFSRLGNPSGTGGVTALLSAIAGAATGNVGATAAIMVGGRGAGFLMSRPRVVRAMHRYARAYMTGYRGRRYQNATQAVPVSTSLALAKSVADETGEDPMIIMERINAWEAEQRSGQPADTGQSQQEPQPRNFDR